MIPEGYPTRDEIEDAVADWFMEHVEHFGPTSHSPSSAAEDMVTDLNTFFIPPADNLEQDCHVCGATVGEHLVDGRHPWPLKIMGGPYTRKGKQGKVFLTTGEYAEWEALG